jgi:hypothetical protein
LRPLTPTNEFALHTAPANPIASLIASDRRTESNGTRVPAITG